MKKPGELRRGDRDELEEMMRSRGDVLRRARISDLRDHVLTKLITQEGQSHAELEGKRARLQALSEVLAIEAVIIAEYEMEREASAFGEDDGEH